MKSGIVFKLSPNGFTILVWIIESAAFVKTKGRKSENAMIKIKLYLETFDRILYFFDFKYFIYKNYTNILLIIEAKYISPLKFKLVIMVWIISQAAKAKT